jgi:glyoxylate carboligase
MRSGLGSSPAAGRSTLTGYSAGCDSEPADCLSEVRQTAQLARAPSDAVELRQVARIDYRMAMQVPESLDIVHAGAVPEVFVIARRASARPISTKAEVTSGPPTRMRVGVFILFPS